MGILVSAKDIHKAFGGRELFTGLTFVIEEGERIGLIGPNGAGKTTLLSILAGNTETDAGELSYKRGLRTGWLEQTPKLPLAQTVADYLGDTDKAYELISKLELSEFTDRVIETLSGGWRKRVALAKELMKDPELLLLDEPTNHLDIESILWLETFLSRASFATITITHDRLFLQRISNRILELDKRNPKGILSIQGDYATYLQKKEELLYQQERQETKLRNTLRRETEWLRRGPKARTTKQNARIKAAYELQDQVEELGERNQNASVSFQFQSSLKKPKRLIEGKAISRSIPGRTLFKDVDIFLGPGDRIGLLGRNGCGKSTLIRTLLGTEAPQSGTVLRSEHLKVAYFEQNREALNPTTTLKRTLCPYGDEVVYRGKLLHVNSYLDRFLFRKEQFDMAVGRLSGGEQARVLLAQLMLKEANVLVLDEPTNDLDIQTLDVLEECLVQFDGAILLVTHDRFFLDQVATTIMAFPYIDENSGKVLGFADLYQWEQWHEEQSKGGGRKATAPAPLAAAEATKKRKLSFNETRELSQMESNIEKAEGRLSQLQDEASLPENQSNSGKLTELYTAIAKAQHEVERLYARWTELESQK